MSAAGWGLLVSRESASWKTEGFTDWMADNGAWADFKAEREFDGDKFDRFLDWVAAQPVGPQMIVLPDIVAGGLTSLELSKRWSNRCLSVCPLVLLAVQDGMTERDVAPLVGQSVGIFLGGSTEWKISTMGAWGEFCHRRSLYYHVARVNTEKRMAMAAMAGADSVDGTSATRYAVTLPGIDRASRQMSLLTPAALIGEIDDLLDQVEELRLQWDAVKGEHHEPIRRNRNRVGLPNL